MGFTELYSLYSFHPFEIGKYHEIELLKVILDFPLLQLTPTINAAAACICKKANMHMIYIIQLGKFLYNQLIIRLNNNKLHKLY